MTIYVEDTIELSVDEYDELLDCRDKLAALEATGVDNWSGWDDAMELYHEWKNE